MHTHMCYLWCFSAVEKQSFILLYLRIKTPTNYSIEQSILTIHLVNEVAGHQGSCDSLILPYGAPFTLSPCFGSFGRSQVNLYKGLLLRSNISCGVEFTVSRNIHVRRIRWKRLRKVLLKPLQVGYWSEWTSILPRQEPPN